MAVPSSACFELRLEKTCKQWYYTRRSDQISSHTWIGLRRSFLYLGSRFKICYTLFTGLALPNCILKQLLPKCSLKGFPNWRTIHQPARFRMYTYFSISCLNVFIEPTINTHQSTIIQLKVDVSDMLIQTWNPVDEMNTLSSQCVILKSSCPGPG